MASPHPLRPDAEQEAQRAREEVYTAVVAVLDAAGGRLNRSPAAMEWVVRQIAEELGVDVRTLAVRPRISPTNRAVLNDMRRGLYALAGLTTAAFFGALATGELSILAGVWLLLIASMSLTGGLVLRHVTPPEDGANDGS